MNYEILLSSNKKVHPLYLSKEELEILQVLLKISNYFILNINNKDADDNIRKIIEKYNYNKIVTICNEIENKCMIKYDDIKLYEILEPYINKL